MEQEHLHNGRCGTYHPQGVTGGCEMEVGVATVVTPEPTGDVLVLWVMLCVVLWVRFFRGYGGGKW
jgi:hypothetical protein